MEYKSLLLCFLHYTDFKMYLSGEEFNKDMLGHNKHRINVRILLGWALEGRIGWATGNLHFFYFANPLTIEFIPQHPQSNLLQPSPPQFKLCMNPLPSKLNYYI